MATVKELRNSLASTTMPSEFSDAILKDASALWLSSDNATQLAGDLAMCYPELNDAEVRARSVNQGDMWRLTVVAHDRKGLLADTAAILSLEGFSIRSASVATWNHLGLALFALTVDGPEPETDRLEAFGAALRAANAGDPPKLAFTPTGRAYVRRTGVANGDDMISVVAPDQTGLLATVCRWFADAGGDIEAAWITGERDEANGVFVVEGDVDCSGLERALTREDHSIEAVVGSMLEEARRAGEALLRAVLEFLRGVFAPK